MGNPILFVRAWTNFWSHRHFFLDDFQHALSAIFVNGGDRSDHHNTESEGIQSELIVCLPTPSRPGRSPAGFGRRCSFICVCVSFCTRVRGYVGTYCQNCGIALAAAPDEDFRQPIVSVVLEHTLDALSKLSIVLLL